MSDYGELGGFLMGHEHERNSMLATEIAPDGIGYGNEDASISLKKQRESGEISEAVEARAADIIKSGECMVDVDFEDDGCIDGRFAILKIIIDKFGRASEMGIDSEHNERAKVAGGGYITALAMLLALQRTGASVDEDLKRVVAELAEEDICCGAHTGEHGHGDATDCGANDKFDLILQNGVRYKNEILGTLQAVFDNQSAEYNDEAFHAAINGWTALVHKDEYFRDSTGKSRLNVIADGIAEAEKENKSGAPRGVVKNLEGDHKEDFVFLNFQKGKTFSQRKFRARMREEFPDISEKNLAQVFVVDAWRIKDLADAIGQNVEDREAALYAGLAFQLATAATLTDGTQRVFANQRDFELVA
jgi:hypothetical protein